MMGTRGTLRHTKVGGQRSPGTSPLPSGWSVGSPGVPGRATAPHLAAGAHIPGAFHRGPARREPSDQLIRWWEPLTGFRVSKERTKPCHPAPIPPSPEVASHEKPQLFTLGQAAPATHRLLALLKEQALFRGSGAWSARDTFRWQVT